MHENVSNSRHAVLFAFRRLFLTPSEDIRFPSLMKMITLIYPCLGLKKKNKKLCFGDLVLSLMF